jgi:hypothetical protein
MSRTDIALPITPGERIAITMFIVVISPCSAREGDGSNSIFKQRNRSQEFRS